MVTQKAPVSPLAVLVARLKAGPPSLSALRAQLGSYEDYADFLRLIKEFVPEHEAEILRQSDPGLQMMAFASRFEDRYFPLYPMIGDGGLEDYADLTSRIPVNVMGLSYDELQLEEFRLGLQLMTFLLDMGEEGEGVRVPLGESLRENVPAALLEKAVLLSAEELHRLLDGTEFQAVAHWANIWNHDTGLYFLDATDEESWNDNLEWDRQTVEELTRDWQQAELINQQVFSLAERLEEDPAKRFKELLDFIEQRRRHEGERGH